MAPLTVYFSKLSITITYSNRNFKISIKNMKQRRKCCKIYPEI